MGVASLALLLVGASTWAQQALVFPIERFVIEGNTLLPPADIEATVKPFEGRERDFGDVQRALEALEDRYRQLGYATVTVLLPEQVLDRGEVRLKVIEGRIANVRISGQSYYDEGNVRATMPSLVPGQVPKLDDVSANLRIANENPGKKLALQLLPGEREGEIDANIRVADERPWKIGATLDNTGSSQTGKRRLGLMFQHANLWNRDHVLTYQYQTSPERPGDVKVHALAYRVPLYRLGDAIDLYSTQSNVNAGTVVAGPIDLAISGSGRVFGVRYTLNLKRRGDYEQQLLFGFDYKAFDNKIGGGGLQLGNAITARPISLQYNGRWQSARGEVSFFASLSRNLPGGANGGQADFDKVRLGAPAGFTVLRGGFGASHAYQSDWQIRLNGSWQWAGRPLIPGEQFGIGGAGTVRGFQEREVANDRGLQASAELHTPDLCARLLGGEHRCRALAFLDAGAAYRVSPLALEQARERIASIGLGLRYAWGRRASLQTDYGRVVDGGGSQAPGDWRIHARLGVMF